MKLILGCSRSSLSSRSDEKCHPLYHRHLRGLTSTVCFRLASLFKTLGLGFLELVFGVISPDFRMPRPPNAAGRSNVGAFDGVV